MKREIFFVVVAMCCGLPFAQATVYVSLTGDNTTGNSWSSAFTSIGAALNEVAEGESIHVAEGRYVIAEEMNVPGDVRILGGFRDPGKGSVVIRDPNQFVSKLDGDGVAGSIFVVSGVNDVEIDGFLLTGCIGAGEGYAKGGAIRVDSGGEVEIRSCDFWRNDIDGYGGGLNVISASADISNCEFRSNSAIEGGGIKVHEGTLEVTRSIFRGNSASVIGGGASGYESELEFSACQFIGNNGPYGGGVEAHEGVGADFENCLFAGNESSTEGGAMSFVFQDDVDISNCTIVRNQTSGIGAGVFMHSSTVEIVNTIFSRNKGHAIFENDSTADPDVRNCLFHANTEGAYLDEGSQTIANATGIDGMNALLSDAEDNLDGDPVFADPRNNDYHIRLSSPAIDTGRAGSATNFDIDGFARPADVPNAGANGTGTEFDIGYDEYDPEAAITLLSPNGGEEWQKGTRKGIEWNRDGYTGLKVKIELWRRNERVFTIANTANDGLFTWTVPAGIADARNYRIVVRSTSFPEFSDVSDYKFSIIEK